MVYLCITLGEGISFTDSFIAESKKKQCVTQGEQYTNGNIRLHIFGKSFWFTLPNKVYF